MIRFEVTAIRTDSYIIKVDEKIYNDAWKEDFAKSFHPIEKLDDIARDLAYNQIRLGTEGSGRFIEGYGPVLRDGRRPFSRDDYDATGKELPFDKLPKMAPGLNIIISSEDEEFDFEIKQLTGNSDE